jgi:hypothetical protein
MDVEREAYNAENKELEKRVKDAEGKKNLILFEMEKEKSRWNLEKQNLIEKTEELEKKYRPHPGCRL